MKRRRIAVLGDLHYEPEHLGMYDAARAQLLECRLDNVFQLGDQGGYGHCGSRLSFREGHDFLQGFDRPYSTLVGNHDLEGAEFASDEDNVAAWCEEFDQPLPYHSDDLGNALAIFLSTTRFRSNLHCPHEIHLEADQIAWFRATLATNRKRPTLVFSHAPIIGSGVRVLQNIHLKCPNAWLNHTHEPEQFIQIARDNPQIKAWFSAHNHLGQSYADSLSVVGSTAFVHTGVIGHVSRDGARHSRLVDLSADGLEISTFDHETGQLHLDWRLDYATQRGTRFGSPEEPEEPQYFPPPPLDQVSGPLRLGNSLFAVHRGMLVEYDRELTAPVGVVIEGLSDDQNVRVQRGELQLVDPNGKITVLRPNHFGRYLQVFVPNRFELRRRA